MPGRGKCTLKMSHPSSIHMWGWCMCVCRQGSQRLGRIGCLLAHGEASTFSASEGEYCRRCTKTSSMHPALLQPGRLDGATCLRWRPELLPRSCLGSCSYQPGFSLEPVFGRNLSRLTLTFLVCSPSRVGKSSAQMALLLQQERASLCRSRVRLTVGAWSESSMQVGCQAAC